MRDWLGFAFTTASFFIALYSLCYGVSPRRKRRWERFRSFKGFGMESTTYEREDDSRS